MIRTDGTYRLATSYAIISLIAVAITAICIFLFFRYQTINIIEEASKRSNEALTLSTEYALNDHFVMFLNFAKRDQRINKIDPALEPSLNKAINKLLRETDIVRVKIYDKEGYVAFSTKQSQIGDGQEDNEGFWKAINGQPATVLIYRDTFNLFDREVEDTNLVQTYVPIRISSTNEVVGVFEIYSDVGKYIEQANRTLLIVSAILIVLMSVLYIVLLFHIKRAEKIISSQHKETQEKKKLLEYLTAKMINAQEDEKKRIAFQLHEDVVQTISGVKMQLERYINTVEQIDDQSSIKDLSTDIVPVLQQAAHKIRAVAIDLRPPSLDDFGLKAAINTLVSECHGMNAGLSMKVDFEIDETKFTQEHKTICYRIFKDVLKAICFDEKLPGMMAMILGNFDNKVVLKIVLQSEVLTNGGSDLSIPFYFNSMQERTILSGGEFSVDMRSEDQISVRSMWIHD
jgi:signal transduction histidine kinase